MDVQELTFGIKDVVAIITGVISIVSFIFAIRHQNEKQTSKQITLSNEFNNYKKEVEEKFLHARNAKKANVMKIYEDMREIEENLKEEITDIKSEQKIAHEKMSNKLDTLSTQMSTMNANLAELTGYMRGKKEDK